MELLVKRKVYSIDDMYDVLGKEACLVLNQISKGSEYKELVNYIENKYEGVITVDELDHMLEFKDLYSWCDLNIYSPFKSFLSRGMYCIDNSLYEDIIYYFNTLHLSIFSKDGTKFTKNNEDLFRKEISKKNKITLKYNEGEKIFFYLNFCIGTENNRYSLSIN